MDPELRKLLQENLSLAKENNRLLRGMRRARWFGVIWSIIFWTVLLLAPLYFYQQYLAPVVARFAAVVPGAQSATTTASGPLGLPSFTELENLVNSYKTKP